MWTRTIRFHLREVAKKTLQIDNFKTRRANDLGETYIIDDYFHMITYTRSVPTSLKHSYTRCVEIYEALYILTSEHNDLNLMKSDPPRRFVPSCVVYKDGV
jgi:hypothetical protein